MELKSTGFLSSNKVKEIKHPMTDYLEEILNRNMQKISLQITQNCNFRCTYCTYTLCEGTQRTHSTKKMPLETAKKAILFLREHSINCKSVYLGIYGGEPLMEFENLKYIVKFAQDVFNGKELKFTMTTNASLLSDEIVEFLIENKFDVVISLDGPKKIHDKNRVFAVNGKGTFDIVKERLEHIHEFYPDFFKKLGVNMVIDPSNDFNEINSLFASLNILNEVSIQSTIVDNSYSNTPTVYMDDFVSNHAYHTFLAYLGEVNRINDEKLSPITMQIPISTRDDIDRMIPTLALREVAAPGGPCMPGQVRPMVTVDGDIFPCERVSEVSEAMKIGSIESGLDMEKAKALLNIGALTPNACRNCWAFLQCGLCAKFADNNGTLSGDKKLSYCNSSRANVQDKMKAVILMNEIQNL